MVSIGEREGEEFEWMTSVVLRRFRYPPPRDRKRPAGQFHPRIVNPPITLPELLEPA